MQHACAYIHVCGYLLLCTYYSCMWKGCYQSLLKYSVYWPINNSLQYHVLVQWPFNAGRLQFCLHFVSSLMVSYSIPLGAAIDPETQHPRSLMYLGSLFIDASYKKWCYQKHQLPFHEYGTMSQDITSCLCKLRYTALTSNFQCCKKVWAIRNQEALD